jgi:hypothetical protein
MIIKGLLSRETRCATSPVDNPLRPMRLQIREVELLSGAHNFGALMAAWNLRIICNSINFLRRYTFASSQEGSFCRRE